MANYSALCAFSIQPLAAGSLGRPPNQVWAEPRAFFLSEPIVSRHSAQEIPDRIYIKQAEKPTAPVVVGLGKSPSPTSDMG